MIEYMKWVKELFPCIDPYTHQAAMAEVRDFMKSHGRFGYLEGAPLDFLAQGDVMGPLPFYFLHSDNEIRDMKAPGLLLSTTCDAENDEFILFSPLLLIDDYFAYKQSKIDRASVIRNHYAGLLYIPESPLDKYVVDLSIVNPFPRDLIIRVMEKGIVTKYCSLSLKGFYFFLSKLTVHLMRPEDPVATGQRCG